MRKRSDFNHALSAVNRLHQEEAGGRQLRPHAILTGSTSNGNRHRVLLPHGGNGLNPDGLLKNSKSVKKRGCIKGLRSNGATRCLQIFDENLRRMAFTNSFYFVTDGSFTADGGLL